MLNPSTDSISSGPRTKPGQASARSKSDQLALSGAKVLVSCWNPPTAIRAIGEPLFDRVCRIVDPASRLPPPRPLFSIMIDPMEHDHHAQAVGHSHVHADLDYGRAFAVGITLNLVYVAGEAVAGILSGSLALIADAGQPWR